MYNLGLQTHNKNYSTQITVRLDRWTLCELPSSRESKIDYYEKAKQKTQLD